MYNQNEQQKSFDDSIILVDIYKNRILSDGLYNRKDINYKKLLRSCKVYYSSKIEYQFGIKRLNEKIMRHKSRALNQDDKLQDLGRMIDFFDAFVERMFPIEVLKLFEINPVQLSNSLISFTDMHFFKKEFEQANNEIDHYLNNGINNPSYKPLNPNKELFYL